VFIPCVKSISEKFRCIRDCYNIRTIFKTRRSLRSILNENQTRKGSQITAPCVCSIPCECGRNYIGETSRPLTIHIQEHRHNLEKGLLEKSRLAQHAFEEDLRIGWNNVKILKMESSSRYRKYKEAAHMSCSTDPTSQPSLEGSKKKKRG
jgi:hypothetical protein